MIKIMLADAHTLFREGERLLIESKPGMRVVGQAKNLAQAVDVATRTAPDLILLELNLDNLGVEAIPRLLAVAPQARLILVTGNVDTSLHERAIQLGAMGVVTKDQSAETFRKALEKVNAGQVWLDRSAIGHVIMALTQAHAPREIRNVEEKKIALLSAREREVIQLLSQGLKNRDIANGLSISETTVRHNLTSIFAKLQVTNRLELIIYAYRHHLVEMPH